SSTMKKSLSQFWCEMYLYPQISKLAFQVLLPFATTYLSMLKWFQHMKTKERNKLNVEDDMRLAPLSSTQPRI
uniref:Uncharacterized protein n=1 Tax=Ciona savignyi TaxID=51511 RepID=H2Y7T4_CIOSA